MRYEFVHLQPICISSGTEQGPWHRIPHKSYLPTSYLLVGKKASKEYVDQNERAELHEVRKREKLRVIFRKP